MGPIGSGKDTQADILAEKFDLYRFRTSKLLEEKFNNAKPDASDYEQLQKEKVMWTGGILNTPSWVFSVVKEKVEEVATTGQGIIFSASPRTLFEAENLTPLLENLYGKDSIKILLVSLSEKESIKRNSKRLVCKANSHPISPNLLEKGIKECPFDGSEFVTRALDKPETIKVRYQEYLHRTAPILDYLRNRDYKITEINGEQPIEKVAEEILSKIND